MELVWCPPGSFMMGSPESELGHNPDEVQHRVTLTKGFWIGKYAVTQEQFEAVTECNPSSTKGSGRPVEWGNWHEAMAFCSRVQLPADGSIPSGYKLSLPTEAQWEYACRAGTTGALNNGLELTSKDGACANLAQVGWYWNNRDPHTHDVGQKSPNAWGLYDMHGSLYEWVLPFFSRWFVAQQRRVLPFSFSQLRHAFRSRQSHWLSCRFGPGSITVGAGWVPKGVC